MVHDTCKSADNCAPFWFLTNTASPSISISILVFGFGQMKKNFRATETRTSSPTLRNESSDLTLPSKKMQDTMVTGSISATEWTDEKHSLYLKSMEASFVNQLYNSKEMLATTPAQFKVLRGGCWQRIHFDRDHPQISRANECRNLRSNPWIQHFRSSGKHQSVASPALEESAASKSQVVGFGQRKKISSVSATASAQLHLFESHMCQKNMLGVDTEMSDQNFIDEEVEGEKENNRNNMKRLKPLINDAADSNQVVSISKPSTTGDVTKTCASAAENTG